MTINLHFTDFCNFCCKHCFVNKEKNELSLETIKIIVDKIYDYSINCNKKIRINLAGGEPLLSKNIQKIIDYICEKGLECSIITNGFLLTEEFINKNKNKLSMIGISVDSLKEETNIKIGRECCKKTISRDRIISLCNYIKKANINLKINLCISKINMDEDFSTFLEDVKPDRIKFLRVMVDHNLLLSNMSLYDNDWIHIIEKYKNISNIIFEDNDYMKESYIIIDSKGNISKNNLHFMDNSIINKDLYDCLNCLKNVRGC